MARALLLVLAVLLFFGGLLLVMMGEFEGMFDGLSFGLHLEALFPGQDFREGPGTMTLTVAVAGEYAVLGTPGNVGLQLLEKETGAPIPARAPQGTVEPLLGGARILAAFFIPRPGEYLLTVTGDEAVRVLVLRTNRAEDPELAEYAERRRRERDAEPAPPRSPRYLRWAGILVFGLGIVLVFVAVFRQPRAERPRAM